jgi:hypothetical protein
MNKLLYSQRQQEAAFHKTKAASWGGRMEEM